MNPWVNKGIPQELLAKFSNPGINDWSTDDNGGQSRINFDGWRYLAFPLPGNYPGEGYAWPSGSQWRWDKDGIVHYPLTFKKLIVELPEKTLHLKNFAPVARPEIYLKDLLVAQGDTNLVKTTPDEYPALRRRASPRKEKAARYGTGQKAPTVMLARDGKALLTISVAAGPAPVRASKKKKAAVRPLDKSLADLRRCLQRITGAEFTLTVQERFPAGPAKPGVYLGTAKDFSWVQCPKDLGPEEFVLRSTGDGQVLLVAGSELGMSHAAYAFLEKLGCRWYFPGDTWEAVPRRPTLAVSLDERQKPDISLQRKLPVGHGLHSAELARDYDDWCRRNRMAGTLAVYNSHIWPGISPDKDFAAHPEWFALVKGKRKPSKPCYSNPKVIARGVAQSLAILEKNPAAQMVSVSAPDGAGFCECELCRQRAGWRKSIPPTERPVCSASPPRARKSPSSPKRSSIMSTELPRRSPESTPASLSA